MVSSRLIKYLHWGKDLHYQCPPTNHSMCTRTWELLSLKALSQGQYLCHNSMLRWPKLFQSYSPKFLCPLFFCLLYSWEEVILTSQSQELSPCIHASLHPLLFTGITLKTLLVLTIQTYEQDHITFLYLYTGLGGVYLYNQKEQKQSAVKHQPCDI